MRWWGWGDPAHPAVLPPHALPFLRQTVGVAERPRPPVALSQVSLPASRLGEAALGELRRIAGADGVRDDHADRVLHAAGKGYPDLVRLRAGTPEDAPDAVVYPASHEQVAALLAACAEHGVAVVPFGGGTSVVGGVAPLRGEHGAVISVDLRRLDAVEGIDRQSLTVVVGGGLRVPALESRLAGLGLTLGHFPQSYEYVTVGGCAATRSAGQASTGYGRFEKLVLGIRCAAPAGDVDLAAVPATAAGPSLRQALVGSEGAFGVITGLALRVRPAPAEKHYEGAFFETFAAGIEALRDLAQHHAAPDVARLSDEAETRMTLALAGPGGARGRLGRAYLRLRGYGGGCLAILGFEGEPDEVAARRRRAHALVRRAGGLPVGRSPGEAWAASRFAGPYLRDELLTLGVMVETLETATQWSDVAKLHGAVAAAISSALQRRGTPAHVACHISHLYETGASLYFTFLARQLEGAELEQWRAAKDAASRVIVEHGATITHHHAVGRDHVPWLGDELGEQGIGMLRALKHQLDPRGVMNPGKLLA
jgi:alkyldihydroxyacetonephosphate synthase